ncbi:MAG TPA: aldo/keto reductase [Bacilli bacterium]
MTRSGDSESYIRQACEASLRRLQTDYLDHYVFHVGGAIPKDHLQSIINALEGLKSEGKILSYGGCTDHPDSARWFADHSSCSGYQFNLNVLYETPGMVQLCEDVNIAAICVAPLAMGLLSGKYGKGAQFAKDDVRSAGHEWVRYYENGTPQSDYLRKMDAVRDILTSGGRSLVQGALAWIWARSPVTVPIPGIKNAGQAVELAKAMEFGPLTDSQKEEIYMLLEQVEATR